MIPPLFERAGRSSVRFSSCTSLFFAFSAAFSPLAFAQSDVYWRGDQSGGAIGWQNNANWYADEAGTDGSATQAVSGDTLIIHTTNISADRRDVIQLNAGSGGREVATIRVLPGATFDADEGKVFEFREGGTNSAADRLLTLTGATAIDFQTGSETGRTLDFRADGADGNREASVLRLNSGGTSAINVAGATDTIQVTFDIDSASTATAVNKTGLGTLNLDGTNTYNAPTTVSGGLLNINGTNASAITVNNGANLGGEGTTTGDITFGNSAGATFSLDIDAGTSAALGSGGALDLTNVSAGGITVNVAGASSAPITVISFDSLVGAEPLAGNFALGTNSSPRGSGIFTQQANSIELTLGFVDNTWVGVDGVWVDGGTGSNWTGGTTDDGFFNGDDATFGDSATTKTVVITGSDVAPSQVTFENTSGAGNDYVINSSGSETLTAENGIDFTGAGNVTINSVIEGATSLSQSGTGTTRLTGANTFSGALAITDGTLVLENSAIRSNQSYTITSGTLRFDVTTPSLPSILALDLVGDGDFVVNVDEDLSLTSSGSDIALGSSSTIQVTGDSTFTFGAGTPGTWKDNRSDLQIDSDATFVGQSTSLVVDSLNGGGDLRIGGNDFASDPDDQGPGIVVGVAGGGGNFSGNISDSGSGNQNSLVKRGGGTQTLSGTNNTFTGSTTVEAGTLALVSSTQNSTIGASPTIDIASGATLDVTGITTDGGFIVGSTQTLTGTGTVNGATTIEGIHAPGTSPGIQRFTDLSYDGGNLNWELIDNTTSGPGTNFDRVQVSNNLTFLNSSTVTLDFSTGVDWAAGFWGYNIHEWQIWGVGGTTTGFPDQLSIFGDSTTWLDSNGLSFSQAITDGDLPDMAQLYLFENNNSIYLRYEAALPEPTTFGLLGLVLATLTGFARPKRRLDA